jgi:hypothetical protein
MQEPYDQSTRPYEFASVLFFEKKKKLGRKSQHFVTWVRGLNFDPSCIFGSMTQPAGLMTAAFNPGRV